MHFTQTVTNYPTLKKGSMLGEPLHEDLPILTTEGKVSSGDNLYATRCSIAYFNCVTAYTTMPEIVQATGRNSAAALRCAAFWARASV